MRKILAAILILATVLGLACACAEEIKPTPALGGATVGGWTPAEDPTVTEERQAIFDKGLEGLLGVGYTPVAYLGSQPVAGTNHAFLCQATVVVPNAKPTWVILYLYENLEGNVSILNIAEFDIGALCTYGAE